MRLGPTCKCVPNVANVFGLLAETDACGALQVQVGHIMVERRKPALLDSAFQVHAGAGRSHVHPQQVVLAGSRC